MSKDFLKKILKKVESAEWHLENVNYIYTERRNDEIFVEIFRGKMNLSMFQQQRDETKESLNDFNVDKFIRR